MKNLFKLSLTAGFLCFCFATKAQNEKPALLLSLHYYDANNRVQWLQVQGRIKANNQLTPLDGAVIQLYLDSLSPEFLITKLRTDEKGEGRTVIPPSFKEKWNASSQHKFIAVAEATNKEDETSTELEISKARISVDTVNESGTPSVSVLVQGWENGQWVPEKGVEVKIGVERLGGALKIGDNESLTTDSLGMVKEEFKLDSLPAQDAKGNLVLIARVEDNDRFGNLSQEKTVPWGKYYVRENHFGERSLWAARFRTPVWLLFMAYSIIATVWTVIIYLLYQIFRIKKLGARTYEEKAQRKEDAEVFAENKLV
ncbi:MAG: hypothetical protein ACJ75B_10855 [Flavisolibacter sp.]